MLFCPTPHIYVCIHIYVWSFIYTHIYIYMLCIWEETRGLTQEVLEGGKKGKKWWNYILIKFFKLRKILLKEVEFYMTTTSVPCGIFSCYNSLQISCTCFKYTYHNSIYLPSMRFGSSNVVAVFSSIVQISSK